MVIKKLATKGHMEQKKISALILSYNNEKEMKRCIESLSFADEVVVLDSFSEDKTAQIAKEMGAKVYQYPFTTFGKLRNLALSHASHPWIFSLDTDEVATPSVVNELGAIMASSAAKDVYFVPRRNTVFGKKLKYGGWYPDYRQPQFFKKEKLTYREKDQVHEGFDILGSTGYLKNAIEQYPFDNIEHYFKKMERYSTLMANRMRSQGRSLSSENFSSIPLFLFSNAIFSVLAF